MKTKKHDTRWMVSVALMLSLIHIYQLKDAQLNMLQKQVTPHFIFNVINSASRMVALEQYDLSLIHIYPLKRVGMRCG